MPPSHPFIDLRSDTVTRPTPAMRRAMAEADVGDDVFGEDPTVNALEAAAAARLGKEAGLFVVSGTMANLCALLTHGDPGSEVLVGEQSHVLRVEGTGPARLGGLLLTPLPEQADGGPDVQDIQRAVDSAHPFRSPVRLLALEITHNFRGGAVLSLERTQVLTGAAKALGLRTHLDGARIFNASVAMNIPARVIAAPFDSVSFCFSKGLAAPVGSMLCGSVDLIAQARRVRKLLGGGMRQAGVLAAAGIVALETMVTRLADDHRNAQRIAIGLQEMGFAVDPKAVATNIVAVPVNDAPALRDRLAAHDVLISVLGPRLARFVTHADVDTAAVEEALSQIAAAQNVRA